MTIERSMYIDKPVLATTKEGTQAAIGRFLEMQQQNRIPSHVMRMQMPQGEYNLSPSYLWSRGYESVLCVLEDGRGMIVNNRMEIIPTYQAIIQGNARTQNKGRIMLPDDTLELLVLSKSQDDMNIELHECVSYLIGSNPQKAVISFS